VAAFKNQHFVPKAHLKPFSDGQEGGSVSLFNLREARIIHRASVAGQCSRSYFYGKDLELERKFHLPEGMYVVTLDRITAAAARRLEVDLTWLRVFLCLQYLRTEAAARSLQDMARRSAELIDYPEMASMNGEVPWIVLALQALPAAVDCTGDLHAVVVQNRSEIPFITSDNPAVSFNKLYFFERGAAPFTNGLGSAGACMFLPLTPNLALLLYDGDVYSVAHVGGWIDVDRALDVLALNEQIVLSARSNLYFSAAHRHDWIPALCSELASERARSEHNVLFAVKDGAEAGMERFRPVPHSESKRRSGVIITLRPPRKPLHWPAFLRWKHRGCAYASGTAVGLLRKATTLAHPTVHFQRVRIAK